MSYFKSYKNRNKEKDIPDDEVFLYNAKKIPYREVIIANDKRRKYDEQFQVFMTNSYKTFSTMKNQVKPRKSSVVNSSDYFIGVDDKGFIKTFSYLTGFDKSYLIKCSLLGAHTVNKKYHPQLMKEFNISREELNKKITNKETVDNATTTMRYFADAPTRSFPFGDPNTPHDFGHGIAHDYITRRDLTKMPPDWLKTTLQRTRNMFENIDWVIFFNPKGRITKELYWEQTTISFNKSQVEYSAWGTPKPTMSFKYDTESGTLHNAGMALKVPYFMNQSNPINPKFQGRLRLMSLFLVQVEQFQKNFIDFKKLVIITGLLNSSSKYHDYVQNHTGRGNIATVFEYRDKFQHRIQASVQRLHCKALANIIIACSQRLTNINPLLYNNSRGEDPSFALITDDEILNKIVDDDHKNYFMFVGGKTEGFNNQPKTFTKEYYKLNGTGVFGTGLMSVLDHPDKVHILRTLKGDLSSNYFPVDVEGFNMDKDGIIQVRDLYNKVWADVKLTDWCKYVRVDKTLRKSKTMYDIAEFYEGNLKDILKPGYFNRFASSIFASIIKIYKKDTDETLNGVVEKLKMMITQGTIKYLYNVSDRRAIQIILAKKGGQITIFDNKSEFSYMWNSLLILIDHLVSLHKTANNTKKTELKTKLFAKLFGPVKVEYIYREKPRTDPTKLSGLMDVTLDYNKHMKEYILDEVHNAHTGLSPVTQDIHKPMEEIFKAIDFISMEYFGKKRLLPPGGPIVLRTNISVVDGCIWVKKGAMILLEGEEHIWLDHDDQHGETFVTQELPLGPAPVMPDAIQNAPHINYSKILVPMGTEFIKIDDKPNRGKGFYDKKSKDEVFRNYEGKLIPIILRKKEYNLVKESKLWPLRGQWDDWLTRQASAQKDFMDKDDLNNNDLITFHKNYMPTKEIPTSAYYLKYYTRKYVMRDDGVYRGAQKEYHKPTDSWRITRIHEGPFKYVINEIFGEPDVTKVKL